MLTPDSNEPQVRKDIRERIQRLFNRAMTPEEERACFFIHPESEDDPMALRLPRLNQEH
jgi:hypothetical protein